MRLFFLALLAFSSVEASIPIVRPADVRHIEVSAETEDGLIEWRMEFSGPANAPVLEDLRVKISGLEVAIPVETFEGISGIDPLSLDIRSTCGFTDKLVPSEFNTGLSCVSVSFVGEENEVATWVFRKKQFVFWMRLATGIDGSKLEVTSVCHDPEFDSTCRVLQEVAERRLNEAEPAN